MRPADGVKLPYRVLHLPLAFNERWTHDAISRYMRSVRSEAPYLPSNVKFIAANNGGPTASGVPLTGLAGGKSCCWSASTDTTPCASPAPSASCGPSHSANPSSSGPTCP